MASLVIPTPSAAKASTLSRENDSSVKALQAAIRAVLEPWERRASPLSSFHFVVREDAKERRFTLLDEDKNGSREPYVLAQFEIRGGKIWLMRNETETDFGAQLLERGIAREEIVLGFLTPAARRDSDYDDGI